MITFHSVMERPDPVSLVIPPIITMQKIRKQPLSNHIAIGLDEETEFILSENKKVQKWFRQIISRSAA
jgi:hypothetical protein